MLHGSADASAFDEFETDIPENKIVPHSSRERTGDVKKRQGRLEHRIRRSRVRFAHRRR
jgi:ribosomal protein S18